MRGNHKVEYSEDLEVGKGVLGRGWAHQVENREQKWGAEIGKDKGPPADSGSFCEAVGVVSEAHEGGALNEQLNEATEPMGAR